MGNCVKCGEPEVITRMLVIRSELYDYECGLAELQEETDDES